MKVNDPNQLAVEKFGKKSKKEVEVWIRAVLEDRLRDPTLNINYNPEDRHEWFIMIYQLNLGAKQYVTCEFIQNALFVELKKRILSQETELILDIITSFKRIPAFDYKYEIAHLINLENGLYRLFSGNQNVQYELVHLYSSLIAVEDDNDLLLRLFKDQLKVYEQYRAPLFLQRSLTRLLERESDFVQFFASALEVAEPNDALSIAAAVEDFKRLDLLTKWLTRNMDNIRQLPAFGYLMAEINDYLLEIVIDDQNNQEIIKLIQLIKSESDHEPNMVYAEVTEMSDLDNGDLPTFSGFDNGEYSKIIYESMTEVFFIE